MNTFSIKTLGCKVNQCDSQSLRDWFLKKGWKESPHSQDADLAIVNTCCVTQHADRKSRNLIRDCIRKRKNAQSRVVVTGCYAEYDRNVIDRIDGIDAVFALGKKNDLLKWIETNFIIANSAKEGLEAVPFGSRTRAFLKIQDGCDNRCSYCIVPIVRGRSRSVEWTSVLRQAEVFASAGHKEIVLTGVNLGSFGRDLPKKSDIVDVIDALEQYDGVFRIRLSSIDAADISERLVNKMSISKKLCPHLHIPFQSGDDKILKDMNKKLTSKDYLRIVKNAAAKIKDLAVTCDMIAGFPGESGKNFDNTLKFLEAVRPLRTHIFTFSERRGVPVYGKDHRLQSRAVGVRYDRLKKLTDSLSLSYKKQYLLKDTEVLFEEQKNGFWQGYSPNYIKVECKSSQSLKNIIKRVQLVKIEGDSVLAQDSKIILDK